jgi:phosphoglucosamine mutase
LTVRKSRRVDLGGVAELQAAIRAAESALHDRGRVLIRYSGTEPLIRVMVEADDETEVRRHAEQLAAVVRESIR